MIVYAITNLINGKRYIGITEYSLKRRWSGHKKYARDGAKTAIHRAMAKYGIENFAIVELASFAKGSSREMLCEMERAFIAREGTLTPNGYNMTPGGDGMPKGEKHVFFGKKMDEAFREKCRNGWTPERRAAAAERRIAENKVKNQSAEHKAKLKAAWARNPERRVKAAEVMAAVMAEEMKKPEVRARMKEAGRVLSLQNFKRRSA